MGYLKRRSNAFGYALSGLGSAIRREPHIRLHLLATASVIAAGWWFHISRIEWLLVTLCIALVIAAELFNSAIERLCDLMQSERDERIKYIKDICSAAVLICCVAAAIAGASIFVPHLP